MPYCPKCGVEVDTQFCPLCNYEIKQDIHTVPFSHSVKLEKKKLFLKARDKKALFNASSIFLGILVSSICITIDYIFDKTLGWSLYPVIVVFTISAITAVALYVKKIFKAPVIIALVVLMLFLLDITIPAESFFLSISFPITFAASINAFLVYILIKKSKNKGANVPAYIILGVSFLTVDVDIIINNYLNGELAITWSLITTVTLLPIAFFLLYIHYVLSKRIDLGRIFHT